MEHDPTGKGDDRYRMRGASAWADASDAVIFHLAPPGRPQRSGLRPTYLLPEKTRAHGLRTRLTITPDWTCEDSHTRGLKLTGKAE